MPKPKRVWIAGDTVTIKTELPSGLVTLIRAIARRYSFTFENAFKMWLMSCDTLVNLNRVHVFGADYAQAYQQLMREEKTAKEAAWDTSKVHRIDRGPKSGGTRNGFVGVYVNSGGSGKTFRAEARTINDSSINGPFFGNTPKRTVIGRDYATPEEAALARYDYYMKNKLPYGIAEEIVDRYRNDDQTAAHYATQTDEAILTFHNETMADIGQPTVSMEGVPSSPFEPATVDEN